MCHSINSATYRCGHKYHRNPLIECPNLTRWGPLLINDKGYWSKLQKYAEWYLFESTILGRTGDAALGEKQLRYSLGPTRLELLFDITQSKEVKSRAGTRACVIWNYAGGELWMSIQTHLWAEQSPCGIVWYFSQRTIHLKYVRVNLRQ